MLYRIVLLFSIFMSFNASAQEMCSGGWQYEQLGFCANSDATCKVTVPVYNACDAQVTDDLLGCGPQSYDSCPNMDCPGSIKGRDYRAVSPKSCEQGDQQVNSGSTTIPYPPYSLWWYDCHSPEKPASCVNTSCKVIKWKSCRHSSCGLERNDCAQFNESYSSKCGSTYGITDPNTAKPTNPAGDGKVVNDYYGLGSACLTCNDIPLDNEANIRSRFECLAKGIELAEARKPGYSFKTTYEILQQLQAIGVNYSANLSNDQARRLTEILSKYNI